MPKRAEFDIGGRRITMEELSDLELERLDEFVQGRFIAAARSSLIDVDTDSDEWRETMAVAMREATLLTWMKQPGIRYLFSSKRGMARILLAGCRQAGYKITIEELVACLQAPRDIEIAHQEFATLNGLTFKRREEANGKANPSYGRPVATSVTE